jgi:hypothetical protein
MINSNTFGSEEEYLTLRPSISQLLQRTRTHLIPFLSRNPPTPPSISIKFPNPRKKQMVKKGGKGALVHIRMILHDVGEDRTTEKDHMSTSGRVLDPDTELRESTGFAVENTRQPQLFQFFFEAGGKAGVHGRSPGEDDVGVEGATDVDVCCLDCVE